MFRILKQSTAVTLPMGPFLDKADGFTAKTALTTQTGRYTYNATGASFTAASWAHDNNGMYLVGLSATHTASLGHLRVHFHDAATYLPVWEDYIVVPAMVYDSMVAGTDVLQADVTQLLGAAISAPATAGILDVNLKNIANAVVNTANAQVGVNVVSQANIDFGALQKISLNAATPAGIQGNVGGNVAGTVGKSAMSLSSQDVTGNLPVDVKAITAGVDLSAVMKASINTEADTALSDAGVNTTRMGCLDADISSRLASLSYTPPDNDTISIIAAALADGTIGLAALLEAINGRSALTAQEVWEYATRIVILDAAQRVKLASDQPDNPYLEDLNEWSGKFSFDNDNNVLSSPQTPVMLEGSLAAVLNKIGPLLPDTVIAAKADISESGGASLEEIIAGVEASTVLAKEASVGGLQVDTRLLIQYVKNKKYLSKTCSTWSLHIRNSEDTADILTKELKDVNLNEIAEITPGSLAVELKSSV